MAAYTENCMVCGESLIYYTSSRKVRCYVCGLLYSTNTTCKGGHYVCDACHAEKGMLFVTRYAYKTDSLNPVLIVGDVLKSPDINMHGPEHHYLVVAALLAAYKNAGGEIDFSKALQQGEQRAKMVPGGICGMWGSCGAGVGTGIFMSIITGATPLSEREWSLANLMTSKSLAVIAENGGPRCCKRNIYLSILQAASFVKEHFSISMELPEGITCEYSGRNAQCRKDRCLFFPSGNANSLI